MLVVLCIVNLIVLISVHYHTPVYETLKPQFVSVKLYLI